MTRVHPHAPQERFVITDEAASCAISAQLLYWSLLRALQTSR